MTSGPAGREDGAAEELASHRVDTGRIQRSSQTEDDAPPIDMYRLSCLGIVVGVVTGVGAVAFR
uniref:hypothetical protein n=1 Tax=Burkholderia anthina TaxID=179879 RepID=UPI001ABA9004